MKSLFILILNYNSATESIQLFQEIGSFGLKGARVFVIDNASVFSDKELLKLKIPDENLIFNNKNLGYAGGNQVGIELAMKQDATHVLLLNPDIRLANETIPTLMAHFNNKETAVVGPRICYRNEPGIIYSDGGQVLKEKGFYTEHFNYNKSTAETHNPGLHEVDYVNGSCFLISTAALKKVGYMRKDFFLYFEETEWCLRAQKNGYKCMVDSNTTAWHSSSIKNATYHYYMVRNRILLAKSQKERLMKTYWLVSKPILDDLFRNVKHLQRPSMVNRTKIKGILSSIFKN